MQDNDSSKEASAISLFLASADGQIPSRCPFSGVSFDPSLLKEWENKMKMSASSGDQVSQLHSMHKLIMQQSLNSENDKEKSDGANNEKQKDVPMQKKSALRRIRFTNSQSKRSKDILMEPSSTDTVWDAIYNNSSVKDANIRKWNSETVRGVKDGTKEIRLEVFGGSSPASSKTYKLSDLRELSTQELVNQSYSTFSDDSDAIGIQEDIVLNLQLCCVDT